MKVTGIIAEMQNQKLATARAMNDRLPNGLSQSLRLTSFCTGGVRARTVQIAIRHNGSIHSTVISRGPAKTEQTGEVVNHDRIHDPS